MLGLVTGAAAQTCATTDVAITGVTPAPSDPAALAGDCAALLGLMDTLRGTASLNWANSLSMASWDGITVTGSRVTDLVLTSRQLTGTIPAALNSLTALQILAFFRNELSGEIPDLSSLTALEELLLASNELSGSIPDLSALTNLRQIELYQNRLSGSIPDLSALTNLNQIHLYDNQLSGEIPDLSGLTELTNVQFQHNQLSGPFPDLSGLSKLGILYLSYNRLSGPIPDLSSLPRLHTLILNDNRLTGSLDASDLPGSLRVLFLHRNRLSGSIPDLSGLTSLNRLVLFDNELSGGIDASVFPTSLTWLYLDRNRLSGSIPDLSALTSLQRLVLDRNRLSGSIPDLSALTSLQLLHLAGNPLTGGIPGQLGSLASLAQLSLCGTDLDASATLPAALETRRTGGQLTVYSCLRIEDASATEGQPLNFVGEHSTYPVRGVAGATGGLTLSYGTEDGTADSGDYTGTDSGSVTIPANTDTDDSTSSATISVPTVDDTAVEGAETMRVILGGGTDVFVLRSTATGTILDNDRGVPPPPPPPPPPPDEDEDGITDEIESGAPNDGDGDCDDVPDAEQSHVVSFLNAKDGRYVSLEAPRQTRLSGVRPLRQPPRGYPPLPPEVTAPISFLGFHLGGVGRGEEATVVRLYLPASLEVNSYWQYGPTRDHGEPHWQPFEHDGETGATFPEDQSRQSHCEGRRIDLHYIDGERGDGDGRRNGVIRSFGAAVLEVPALAPVSIDLLGEEGAVGLALHNPTNADNAVAMSVVDAGGERRRQVELEEALEEKGQLARMVCELIDCELESGASAVVARGRQGHLRSMFMVGTRDGRKLDGVSGEFEAARRLLFPIVQSEGARATLLFVFNPTLVETGVTFSRYRKDGSFSASVSREVAGGGFVMETATGLFGGAEEGAGGYVEARGENKLLGFAFLRDEESFAALAAQVPRDLTEEESFHAPHFEMGAESRTTLYVLSALRNHTTRLRVRAIGEDGQPLGEAERELSRDGGSLLLVSDLDELLPLPASAQPEGRIEGYLKLDFSVTAGVLLHIARPRVLGAVEVVRGGSRTVLPLVGSRDIPERSFLQVAHSERPDSYMSTSLSILNPGSETAMVRLRVFDPAGRPRSAERIVSIVPGSRLSGSLEAEWLLDPRFTQAGGHLQVISDRPVISFALFTGRNGQYLSAIAARPGSP